MVSKILLVSFTLCSTSAFVTLSFQLTSSILLQMLNSQASSLFLSAVDNVQVSQLHVRLWRIQQQTLSSWELTRCVDLLSCCVFVCRLIGQPSRDPRMVDWLPTLGMAVFLRTEHGVCNQSMFPGDTHTRSHTLVFSRTFSPSLIWAIRTVLCCVLYNSCAQFLVCKVLKDECLFRFSFSEFVCV